jgi:molybdopterin converting factor small subunit
LAEGATVAELRRQILCAVPALAGLLDRSAIAVNNEFAQQGTPLHSHDEIALLPPVSGG